MKDGFGREIDYMRVSVTDRCDLRCVYCMPERGVEPLCCGDVLRYEEILRLTRIFAGLGIRKIRLTGGEPLVRRNLPELVAGLKTTDGIETVALTTNGMLLADALPSLMDAGLDAVNISIDALEEAVFRSITRRSGVDRVLKSIDAALACPDICVKLNCVPTDMNRSELLPLVRFAAERSLPMRFIELMPIGEGAGMDRLGENEVKAELESAFGELMPIVNGDQREKCRYYALPEGGEVGFISAISHKFCSGCNRVRLTADGFLKTCLQYDAGVKLKPLLERPDDEIREAISDAVINKPACHQFEEEHIPDREERRMSQIGG
jgi:GTP 3',8-cyclase